MSLRYRANGLRNRGPGLGSLLTLALLVFQVGTSWAQNPHESLTSGGGGVPDVPPGFSSILVQVVHPDGNKKTEGSAIVLYSLTADGSPGVRSSVADANGAFRFVDLSNAPGITYLVGARYRGVPYGKRVTFEPGQREILLLIDVADPTSDISGISVGASSLRLEWIGANLGVEEIHQLDNSGSDAVFVAPEERAGKPPPFRTTLAPGAERIDTTLSGNAEGYEVRGDELVFWGPVYADGLELRFRYLIPIANSGEGLSLRWQLDSGSRRATLLYPPGGLTLSVAGVSPGADVELADGPFHSLDAGEVAPGGSVEVSVALPEMTNDRSAISLPRADFWLDADDIFLQVNVDLSLEVAPGAHLAGSVEAPLLEFDLPPGAEFRGLSPQSRTMGLMQVPGGDLVLIGPLAPGAANLAFRFRLPVSNSKPQIDIRLPGAVGLLNVLIADTGVVIKTDRLHRRRPFREKTRVYLHREAFAIDPGEVISIDMELINRGTLDRNTYLFATSSLAALGVWFMASPLVRGRRTRASQLEQAHIRSERELVYQSIRDLEHDFETAKVEAAAYQTMRTELRARALDLLKQEHDSKHPQPDHTQPPSAPARAEAAPAGRCGSCGSALDAGWRFCPGCGASSSSASSPAAAELPGDVANVTKEEP